jgi:hypothetical protein
VTIFYGLVTVLVLFAVVLGILEMFANHLNKKMRR